jgi:hypothetical protein
MEPTILIVLLIAVAILKLLLQRNPHRDYEYVKSPSGSRNPVAAAVSRGYNTASIPKPLSLP